MKHNHLVGILIAFFSLCACDPSSLGNDTDASQGNSSQRNGDDNGGGGNGGSTTGSQTGNGAKGVDNTQNNPNSGAGAGSSTPVSKATLLTRLDTAEDTVEKKYREYGAKETIKKSIESAEDIVDDIKKVKKATELFNIRKELRESLVLRKTNFTADDIITYEGDLKLLLNPPATKENADVKNAVEQLNSIVSTHEADVKASTFSTEKADAERGSILVREYADSIIEEYTKKNVATQEVENVMKTFKDPFIAEHEKIAQDWLGYNKKHLNEIVDAEKKVREAKDALNAAGFPVKIKVQFLDTENGTTTDKIIAYIKKSCNIELNEEINSIDKIKPGFVTLFRQDAANPQKMDGVLNNKDLAEAYAKTKKLIVVLPVLTNDPDTAADIVVPDSYKNYNVLPLYWMYIGENFEIELNKKASKAICDKIVAVDKLD